MLLSTVSRPLDVPLRKLWPFEVDHASPDPLDLPPREFAWKFKSSWKFWNFPCGLFTIIQLILFFWLSEHAETQDKSELAECEKWNKLLQRIQMLSNIHCSYHFNNCDNTKRSMGQQHFTIWTYINKVEHLWSSFCRDPRQENFAIWHWTLGQGKEV